MIFDSHVMDIKIIGSTVRYSYLGKPAQYEIRHVTAMDLAALQATIRHPRYSSSATVQLLTKRYRANHFDAGGRSAKPCSIPERDLLPLTPFMV